MPRNSARDILIRDLDNILRVMSTHGTDESDSLEAEEILDLKFSAMSTRYLNLREYVKKNRSMNEMLFTYSDRDFIQAVRMVKGKMI